MKCKMLMLSAVLLLSFGVSQAFNDSVSVAVYDVDNGVILPAGDTIWVDADLKTYEFRISIENDSVLGGMSLGFKIYSEDGASWSYNAQPGGLDVLTEAVTIVDNTRLDGTPAGDGIADAFDMTKLLVTEVNVDGMDADTMVVGGVALMNGLPAGALEYMVTIHWTPSVPDTFTVRTICIDSAFVPPASPWTFSNSTGTQAYPPSIGDPVCFECADVRFTDTDDGKKPVPRVYSLQQNFPNPFNPATTITYSVPRKGHVDISVFNILGQRVATLVNESQEAAEYTITWDGMDESGHEVASGIYFYKMTSRAFVETRKMVLMR